MSGGRRLISLGLIVGMLAFALLFGGAGRGSADTSGPTCPPTGKSICVSITDQAQASRTPTGSDHYLTDFVTVSNGGATSNLVNITVTITWTDLGATTTTSEYRPTFSDPRCTAVPNATRTLSCTPPKSLGPGTDLTYGPLVFRTATIDSAATDTELTATATAKEQGVAKQGKNPPTATTFTNNATTYEGSPDQDVSWAGEAGMNVTLATAPPATGQHSNLNIPAGAMPTGDFATLTETTCPTGQATCIGEKVTIQASGISPVNLQIFYTGPLPSGLTKNNLVVVHNGVSITRACSGDFFTQPTDLFDAAGGACRRVSIDKSGPGDPRVIVDAWDTGNGDWRWG
jgi:hypothetical protein